MPPKSAERLPPQNREAERSVLGAVMRQNSRLDEIDFLSCDDFYCFAHKKIMTAIRALAKEGKPADPATVADRINTMNLIDDIGGYAYLAELWDAAPCVGNAVHYAEIVREKAIRRNLIHATAAMVEAAYDEGEPVSAILETAEKTVFSLAAGTYQSSATSWAELWPKIWTSIGDAVDARNAGIPLTGLMTGFADLDELTGGFKPDEFVVVGARPGIGKSVLLANIARNLSNAGNGCLLVSLEMMNRSIMLRVLSSVCGVPADKIRDGLITDEEGDLIFDAGEKMAKNPGQIYFNETMAQTMGQIASLARRLAANGKIKAVLIDYLQLVEGDRHYDNSQERVATISRKCKFLARELMIPVIAAAQVNRKADENDDTKPRLSHLRDSGGIEQDADIVLLLSRDMEAQNNYLGTLDPVTREAVKRVEGCIEVEVAKNRDGATGVMKMFHRKQTHLLQNMAKESSNDRQVF